MKSLFESDILSQESLEGVLGGRKFQSWLEDGQLLPPVQAI
jgi:hypothetical protein